MHEINVWSATHMDEWQPVALLNALRSRSRQEPRAPVHARVSQAKGYEGGREGTDNLVLAFPGSRKPTAPYTSKRAAEIVKRSCGAYANFDAHQVTDYGLRTAYIDLQRGVSPRVLGFLRGLGMYSLIGTEGWGMQGYVWNTALLESTYDVDEREAFVDAVYRLSSDPKHPTARPEDFTWYRYAGALSGRAYDIKESKKASTFQPLQEIPADLLEGVSLGGTALHVLNWREFPLKSGIWGEGVTSIPVPDSRRWPEHAAN